MVKLNLLDELQVRGFVSKISNIHDLEKQINHNIITLYCGFDPTSDSLHVGHLLPLLCLKWFQKYNHNIVVLIGGATGLIGDPSFKDKERLIEISDMTIKWSTKIKSQISCLFKNLNFISPIIVNNYDWFKKINIISFLRDIGKYFSINKMMNRKSVKNRINRIDQGISFTEFSYNLLQSYDFLQLYKKYHVTLQIGGSDQWGNISSGIDLVRRLCHIQVFGLTTPLLTQSNGIKFGKTEKNTTIWLNSTKTTPYAFYQFWLNTSDDKIIDFLKLFTFLKIKEIDQINKQSNMKNQFFYPKSILADYVTKMIHGQEELNSAKRITNILFSGNFHKLTEYDFYQLKKDGMMSLVLNGYEDLRQVLVNSKLSSSRTHAYQLIISHAIRINNRKEINPKYLFCYSDKLFGKFTLITRGKKNHFLLCW
ncbi:Tyrosine--tRNA ligase [Buchnera aphidicola (Phyllaphis fagi)]|uniref:tyrosine--tRNA ligase n=1 Tax=Buchnera aphidicola TaxID=9 RepID=UPI003464C380